MMQKEFFSKNLFPNAIFLLTKLFLFDNKTNHGLRLGLVDNSRVPKNGCQERQKKVHEKRKNRVFKNLGEAADKLNNQEVTMAAKKAAAKKPAAKKAPAKKK